jgi:methionyl-tRNA formyltransferase
VLARRTIPIGANDTARTLTAALATLGGELIVEALHDLASLAPRPQPQDGVTYAAKIEKAEAPLDFRMPANVLADKVRSFDPFPGASVTFAGQVLKLWGALPGFPCGGRRAGEIVTVDEQGIVVACGSDTSLVLVELQRAGGKRLPARQFLQGFPLAPGERFELET